jgi:hypothetical protein
MRDSLAPAARAMSRELAAVVEGHHAQLGPLWSGGGGAVQMGQLGSASTRGLRWPPNQWASSAGVGMAGAQAWRDTTMAPQALASRAASAKSSPRKARHQAGSESVTGAQHVHHLDAFTLCDLCVGQFAAESAPE